MAKFDKQLSRMAYLMEYKMPKNEVVSNIEYHANGADGKVYGIIKEGTKYYIKTTESGKENISESYEYIGGINNRKNNEYRSYNDATKHLELKLMSLNEAYGRHQDVSTVDFKRSEKTLSMLTEDARRELNRMHQIFENSNAIGSGVYKGEDKESKGKATDPKAQSAPFGEGKAEGTHENGTSKTQSDAAKANKDYEDASKNVESKLTSTEMPKGGEAKNDMKDAHDDLDGESVADKKPKGGKAVMVNEGMFEDDLTGFDEEEPIEDDMSVEDFEEPVDDMGTEEPIISEPVDDMELEEPVDDISAEDFEEPMEDDEFDALLQEMESCISGPCKEMTGPGTDNPKNSISMENGPASNPINEDETDNEDETINEDETQEAKDGGEAIMKGEPHTANGQGGHQKAIATWERVGENGAKKLDEAIARETKRIMEAFGRKETIEETIQRLVKEETTKLNVWGKHPRFRKQPMTTPQNKEVLAGTADRDWNDDSAKGEQPYGMKIGNSAPFDKQVEMLTDAVLTQLKESFLKKK